MTSAHTTPWSDLPVEYVTDKIPPGWHVGCNVTLEKYLEALDDWCTMTSYETNKSRVGAMRLRLKGTVKEFMDSNRLSADSRVDPYDDFITKIKGAFGKTTQNIHEQHFIAFFKYQRKRDESPQVYTANHDRLYARAVEGKLEMGNVARSFWYLWMGHFTDEQRRWILGKDVDNDYNKYKQIVKNALNMPESMTGHAHFAEFEDAAPAFLSSINEEKNTKDDFEEAYWELYNAYWGTSEKDWNEEREWSNEEIAAYQASEEWYDSDGNWYGDYGDAFMSVEEQEYWEAYYGQEYEEEEIDLDDPSIYLAGASDVDTESDEKECEVWLAARKSHRAHSRFRKTKKTGRGRSKGRGKGVRRKFGKGRPSWLPPPGKGCRDGFKGKSKGFGKKGKGKSYPQMSPPPWSKGKGKGKGKKR